MAGFQIKNGRGLTSNGKKKKRHQQSLRRKQAELSLFCSKKAMEKGGSLHKGMALLTTRRGSYPVASGGVLVSSEWGKKW